MPALQFCKFVEYHVQNATPDMMQNIIGIVICKHDFFTKTIDMNVSIL